MLYSSCSLNSSSGIASLTNNYSNIGSENLDDAFRSLYQSNPPTLVDLGEASDINTHSIPSNALYTIPDTLMVSEISDVDIRGQNIFFLDKGGNRLLVKGSEDFEIIGREGKGPVEFNEPDHLSLSEDKIYIYEHRNGRIQVIDSDNNVNSIIPAHYEMTRFNNFAYCSNHVIVPTFSNQKTLAGAYNIRSQNDTTKALELVPRLIKRGYQPRAANSIRISCDQDNTYVAYTILPIVVEYDTELEPSNIFQFSGNLLEDFYNNAPEYQQLRTDDRVVRAFYKSITVFNDLIYFSVKNRLFAFDINASSITGIYDLEYSDESPVHIDDIEILRNDSLVILDVFNQNVVKIAREPSHNLN